MHSQEIHKKYIHIDTIKQTSIKSTHKYNIKSAKITPKNTVIVKVFAFKDKIKERLIYQQLNKLSRFKSINPIKQIIVESNILTVVQEYETKGDLSELIEGQSINLEIMLKICEGVEQLHRSDIMHCNLKPENILVTNNNSIKFTDLSVAYLNSLVRKQSYKCQLSPYQAQQLDEHPIFCKQDDIWSLGVILMELAIHRRLTKGDKANIQGVAGEIKNESFKNLVGRMCCPRESRLTIHQAVLQLKSCINKQSIQKRDSFINLKMSLFTLSLHTIDEIFQLQLQSSIDFEQFTLQCRLFTGSQGEQILIIVINKINLQFMYTQLPSNVGQYFKSLFELFHHIQNTQRNQLYIDIQGNLNFRIKADNQPLNGIDKVLVSDTKQVQIKGLEPQEILIIENNQQRQIQQIVNNQPLQVIDEELAFESDEQLDFYNAYQNFPMQSQLIMQAIDTIKITLLLQPQNVLLISLQYEYLGKEFSNLYQYEHAKKAYKLARQGYCRKYGSNSERQMNLLCNLGYIYAVLLSFSNAIACYKRCVFIGEALQDANMIGTAYYNIGQISFRQRDYAMSQKCYLKSADIFRQNKLESDQLRVWQNLSKLYFKQQEYEKANKFFELCVSSGGSSGKGMKRDVVYLNWGISLLRLNRLYQIRPIFE